MEPERSRRERFRRNTISEKRTMRNQRVKRKRKKARASVESQLESERTLRVEAEKKVRLYKNMSRCYWERWHREFERRKTSIAEEKRQLRSLLYCPKTTELHEIHPDLLQDVVVDGDEKEMFIGRGSFGVVRLQFYRRMKVAVKEMLPHTSISDVVKEAAILAQLCHPNLPLLFGVVTSKLPYRIVMQYHGLTNSETSITLSRYLTAQDISRTTEVVVVCLCTQLAEALRYLHEEVKLLHNDLKCSNVLVCDSLTTSMAKESPTDDPQSSEATELQVVVIDFGKATTFTSARKYSLSTTEQLEFKQKFPHISPEVVEGIATQSTRSDIFSLGRILCNIATHSTVISESSKKQLNTISISCQSSQPSQRPTATEVCSSLENLLMKF